MKPLTDLPFALLEGVELWAVPPVAGLDGLRLSSTRPGPKGPLLTIAGVTSLAAGRALAGSTLVVRTADVPEDWNDDEFDPVGYVVSDAKHGTLGTIIDVIYTGANDVWDVDGPLGQILIPVIDEVVLEINDEAQTITVELLPGLLDED